MADVKRGKGSRLSPGEKSLSLPKKRVESGDKVRRSGVVAYKGEGPVRGNQDQILLKSQRRGVESSTWRGQGHNEPKKENVLRKKTQKQNEFQTRYGFSHPTKRTAG